jgi:hypothetical protein
MDKSRFARLVQTLGHRQWQALLTLVAAASLIAYGAVYLLASHPPHDHYGYVIGRDFVNSWMGARAVVSGQVEELFHLTAYNREITALFGKLPPLNWSYPPVVLLFLGPLGWLPYLPALVLWSLAGFAAYLLAARSFGREGSYLAFVAVAPAIGICLFCGQNGFFTAALLILFFRFWDQRPWLAGLCLGLMLYKPHLVVLFPLALALSGRWRVFAAAALTTLGLIALTALVFGPQIWSDYVRLVGPVQKGVMETGSGFLTMMPTGFMQARMMGADLASARLVQIPFTLLALAALLWTFAKRRDPLLSIAVLVTASFVVTPYAFDYDMVVFGWLIALLWPRFDGPWDRVLLLVIWTLPIAMLFYGSWSLPIAAPLMALFLIRLVQKQRGGNRLPAAPAL